MHRDSHVVVRRLTMSVRINDAFNGLYGVLYDVTRFDETGFSLVLRE